MGFLWHCTSISIERIQYTNVDVRDVRIARFRRLRCGNLDFALYFTLLYLLYSFRRLTAVYNFFIYRINIWESSFLFTLRLHSPFSFTLISHTLARARDYYRDVLLAPSVMSHSTLEERVLA